MAYSALWHSTYSLSVSKFAAIGFLILIGIEFVTLYVVETF